MKKKIKSPHLLVYILGVATGVANQAPGVALDTLASLLALPLQINLRPVQLFICQLHADMTNMSKTCISLGWDCWRHVGPTKLPEKTLMLYWIDTKLVLVTHFC